MKQRNGRYILVAGALMATLVIPTAIGMTAQAKTSDYFKIKAENDAGNISKIVGADRPLTSEEQAEKDRLEQERLEAEAAAKETNAWENCGAVLPASGSRSPGTITRIAFGNGSFYTGDGEAGWKSTDGCSWGSNFSTGGSYLQNLGDMVAGPAGFMAATNSTSAGSSIYPFVHINRSNVATRPMGSSLRINHLAATPDGFAAASTYGGNPGVYISYLDGTNKIPADWMSTNKLAIRFGVGSTGAKALASSTTETMVVFSTAKGLGHITPRAGFSTPDSKEVNLAGDWSALNWANGIFTALSADGKQVATSTDGKTWSVKDATGLGINYKKLVQGDGYYVAVNQLNNKVATSKDGVKWREYSLPGIHASAKINDVEFGNGKFVVVVNIGSDTLQFWDLELAKLK